MTPKSHARGILLVAAAALFLLSGALGHAEPPAPKNGGAHAALTVTSSAFVAGGSIPAKYTCEGANVSPPLSWTGAPAGTKSFALICDDPDAPAGIWVHWVLYNLPPNVDSLSEKTDAVSALSNGAMQGANDFGKVGYGGPCPPPGKSHRYFFKVYALDIDHFLKPGAHKDTLIGAMEHHILAEGQLIGTCQRKK
jgi:Raf kinase inhibitor-like YbhB/YbcL family protein